MKELAEGIFLFEKIVPESICDSILNFIKQQRWEPASLEKTIFDPTPSKAYTQIHYLIDIEKTVLNNVLEVYREFREEGHKLEISTNSQPIHRFIRYEKDADMKTHFDSLKGDRVISLIVYLNDDYEGGEVCYPKQGLSLKMKKGDILIHPAIFTHPHRSEKITEGEKFICLSVFGLLDPKD